MLDQFIKVYFVFLLGHKVETQNFKTVRNYNFWLKILFLKKIISVKTKTNPRKMTMRKTMTTKTTMTKTTTKKTLKPNNHNKDDNIYITLQNCQ